MTTTFATYNQISNNLDRYTTMTEKETDVASATKYYQDNIGKITSIDDFMNNDRIYRYAMKAYGLDDMTYAKAMVKKVLQGGTTDSKSLANTLSDKRFLALAKAFDFATNGTSTTTTASATTDTVNNYVRQAVEDDAGKQDPGVQLALYFSRKAPTITSAYDILADKSLLKVVQTALGISEMTSLQDIDKQATMISGMMNISDLQDPAKLQKFLDKFTAKYDMNNTSSDATATASLFDTTSSVGISSDILSAIQGLKLGGI